MQIILNRGDLHPEHRDVRAEEISYTMFCPSAVRAILEFGKAYFADGDGLYKITLGRKMDAAKPGPHPVRPIIIHQICVTERAIVFEAETRTWALLHKYGELEHYRGQSCKLDVSPHYGFHDVVEYMRQLTNPEFPQDRGEVVYVLQ